jgi:hypothetical protein
MFAYKSTGSVSTGIVPKDSIGHKSSEKSSGSCERTLRLLTKDQLNTCLTHKRSSTLLQVSDNCYIRDSGTAMSSQTRVAWVSNKCKIRRSFSGVDGVVGFFMGLKQVLVA